MSYQYSGVQARVSPNNATLVWGNAARSVSSRARFLRNPSARNRETSQVSKSLDQQGDERFTLANGNTMGFSLCGPIDASALFYFHGQCTSRLQGLAFANSAKIIRVRVICPNRPGIGLSTLEPGRRLLDCLQQITELARHLGLNMYSVMGGSGGGPYAIGGYLLAHSLSTSQILGVPRQELGISRRLPLQF